MKIFIALTTVLAVEFFHPAFGLSETEEKLVSANNDFALRLFKVLPSDETENVFFSPYSLSTALGMTYAGARGTTQEELTEKLGYSDAGLSDAEVLEAFAQQNDRLQAHDARESLEVANSAAVQEGFGILHTYHRNLTEGFNARLFQLDFARKGEQAVDTINEWVKEKTHDKIEKLFDEPLDTNTKLVLVNAIVFKGLWQSQFSRNKTTKRPFYNGGKDRTEVDLMFQTVPTYNSFDRTLQAAVVELLYRVKDYSMVVVLPFERDGVEAVKQVLTLDKLEAVTASLKNTTIDFYLPKFELEKQNDLKDDLMNVGVEKIFGNADLSGITGHRNLVVSDIVQRALVKVDEEGTEAAAATGVHIIARGSTRPPEVVVDHPFLFFIRNRRTREILFAGQVNKL